MGRMIWITPAIVVGAVTALASTASPVAATDSSAAPEFSRVENPGSSGAPEPSRVEQAGPSGVSELSRVNAWAGGVDAEPEPACPDVTWPRARCLALYSPDVAANRGTGAQAQPNGHGAADIASAYNLPVLQGKGQTVAIVAAYDAPNAEKDLGVYRETYGLPPCTTANGCFTKVNQRGKTSPLPEPDVGWSVEISLDLDMVSAACPHCDILLVEADSAQLEDLSAAVDTAAEMGADVISNSYGTRESADMSEHAGHYDRPGIAITAAAGNDGHGPASFPAVLPTVTAVGGTVLTKDDDSRGWGEKAWKHSGSACSEHVAKPGWQPGDACDKRTIADVSAVAADVAVYDTYEQPGWLSVSGTSASAPIIAGVYALAGNAGKVDPSYPYENSDQLFDITSGSTGECGGTYLCDAVQGYDGPTGLGTPNGAGGF